MAKHIIPFNENANLPSNLAALDDGDDWGSGHVGGFPVISLKSKVFHICRGEDKELVTRPDDPDEAAGHISVVVIKTHKGVARTFYRSQYEEGSSEKPDCYSNDGIAPAADAEDPQNPKCATCPHAQWGSRITENNKKGKACSEVKRLAVAAPGQLNDPMLLRVPPTSLKNWDQYVDMLRKRGAVPAQVVTKISFDHSVSHQLLTFKPIGFLDGPLVDQLIEVRDSEIVKNIIGQGPDSGYAGDPPEANDKAAKKANPTPAAVDDDDDDDGDDGDDGDQPTRRAASTSRRRKGSTDDKPAAKGKSAAKSKPAPPADEDDDEQDTDDLDAELDEVLSSLSLDD